MLTRFYTVFLEMKFEGVLVYWSHSGVVGLSVAERFLKQTTFQILWDCSEIYCTFSVSRVEVPNIFFV